MSGLLLDHVVSPVLPAAPRHAYRLTTRSSSVPTALPFGAKQKIGLTGAHLKTTRLCGSFRRLTCFRMPLMIHCPDLLVAFCIDAT